MWSLLVKFCLSVLLYQLLIRVVTAIVSRKPRTTTVKNVRPHKQPCGLSESLPTFLCHTRTLLVGRSLVRYQPIRQLCSRRSTVSPLIRFASCRKTAQTDTGSWVSVLPLKQRTNMSMRTVVLLLSGVDTFLPDVAQWRTSSTGACFASSCVVLPNLPCLPARRYLPLTAEKQVAKRARIARSSRTIEVPTPRMVHAEPPRMWADTIHKTSSNTNMVTHPTQALAWLSC